MWNTSSVVFVTWTLIYVLKCKKKKTETHSVFIITCYPASIHPKLGKEFLHITFLEEFFLKQTTFI